MDKAIQDRAEELLSRRSCIKRQLEYLEQRKEDGDGGGYIYLNGLSSNGAGTVIGIAQADFARQLDALQAEIDSL